MHTGILAGLCFIKSYRSIALSQSFFTELKRRNVFKVGTAYLVLAWIVIQVTDTAVPALHLPEWVNSFVFFIGAIGFPFALFFAWIFEVTPAGVRLEADIKPEESISAHTGKNLDYIIITLLVIALGYFIYDSQFKTNEVRQTDLLTTSDLTTAPTKDTILSIAVLPFSDMSSTGDQEYFGDGIAEELLNVLAKTKGLRVAARTSSFKFKNADVDIIEIGKALNVTKILEGSIRKAGDQIRVTAQLINVADGYHIWSETYDRELKNIFQVQDEISQSIVGALKLELDLSHQTQSVDVKAYELYLKGREYTRQPIKERLLKALDYYQQALEIEPDYARVYAGIASAWIWLEDYGGYSAEIAYPQVEKNARKSLQLDDEQAEALMSMGIVYNRIYGDELAAQFFIKQAIMLNPSHVEIYSHFADVLWALDMHKKVLQQRNKAVLLDPLSTFYHSKLVAALSDNNMLPEAWVALDRLFELDPEDAYGWEEKADLLFDQGDLAESIKGYIKVHHARPGDAFSAGKLASMFHLLGDVEKSNHWIKESRLRGENNRWLLNATTSIALYKADWQALLDNAELKVAADKNIAASWAGYAYLGLGDDENALAKFTFVTSQFKLRNVALSESHLSFLGMALLKKNSAEAKKYQVLAENVYLERLKTNNPTFGRPTYNAYFGLACLKLNTLSSPSEMTSTIKNEVLELLNEAIDASFNDATFLKNDLFFRGYQNDEDFIKVVERIKALNDVEIEKLAKME